MRMRQRLRARRLARVIQNTGNGSTVVPQDVVGALKAGDGVALILRRGRHGRLFERLCRRADGRFLVSISRVWLGAPGSERERYVITLDRVGRVRT